jgi:hypothetical protein
MRIYSERLDLADLGHDTPTSNSTIQHLPRGDYRYSGRRFIWSFTVNCLDENVKICWQEQEKPQTIP